MKNQYMWGDCLKREGLDSFSDFVFSFQIVFESELISKCTLCCCQIWAGAPSLLLGIVRQATKTNMQDCWSFTWCFS